MKKKRPACEVLGVEASSSPDKVKKQYRALARYYHPDRNPGNPETEEKFKEVQEAFDEMSGKSNANGDPEQGAVLQILSDALFGVTVQVIDMGSDVAKNDIVKLMKTGINHAKEEHKKGREKSERILKELKKHQGRFTTQAGTEDILTLLALSRIAAMEQQLRVTEIMLGRLDKALAILNLYGYKVEDWISGLQQGKWTTYKKMTYTSNATNR